ncbi:MAG: ester cyclase [Gemmatimonadota bacterium]
MKSQHAVPADLVDRMTSTYLKARNMPDLDLLDEIYAEDVVVHDCSAPEDIVGLEALKGFYLASHAGFPDFKMSIDEAFPAEDRIVFVWTIKATHTGELRGMPPTGRSVSFSGVALDRVEEGVIVEESVYFNLLDLLQQLGLQVVPGRDQE